MNWKKILTPINTEEVRPGLFIQSREKHIPRVINPICWDGKYRWKKQFSWKNLFTIIIILFLALTYFNSTSYCREFQENPCEMLPDIKEFCSIKINEVDYEEGAYPPIVQDYP